LVVLVIVVAGKAKMALGVLSAGSSSCSST
jgi:hypothetical protein